MIKIRLLALLLLYFLSCQSSEKTLTIATASNMQFAMSELAQLFEEKTAIKTNIIISSSGKICAQIKEGAPYHIFVSADMKYPADVFRTGFAYAKPTIYAYGNLVMWTMIDTLSPTFEQLHHQNIRHIAIANPKTAPYGAAALSVLQHQDVNFSAIEKKLVYGESISQTNQFIISKAAEIGFTAKSIVLSPKMKGKGHWISIDKNTYQAIEQGIILIKQSDEMLVKSQKFHAFLFSKEGQDVLKQFGYEVKE